MAETTEEVAVGKLTSGADLLANSGTREAAIARQNRSATSGLDDASNGLKPTYALPQLDLVGGNRVVDAKAPDSVSNGTVVKFVDSGALDRLQTPSDAIAQLERLDAESGKALQQQQLVHISDSSVLNLRDVDPGTGPKPHGLWFSPNHEWARYSLFELPDKLEGHAFLLDTSHANILHLTKPQDLEAFHSRYGILEPNASVDKSTQIDWKKLAKDYDGVSFANTAQNERQQPQWYSELWVDSGSVWNASKLKAKPIGQMPSLQFDGHNLAEDLFDLQMEGIDPLKQQEFQLEYERKLDAQLKSHVPR